MAQKRMLNKSISLSKQVNELSLKSKLIFTWSIPHLDDFGLIDNDPYVLKATVCPMLSDVGIKDINIFIDKAWSLGLIEVYGDCLEFLGFENHQSLSEEKKAKSKFCKIPRNPQENSGENNNPQKSPVQEKGIEVKRSEVKIGEGDTPQLKARKFFSLDSGAMQQFVSQFCEKTGIPVDSAKSEIRKFVSYWTEKNKSGTKEKWELESTFEVDRRLSKWFNNAQKWSQQKPKGKSIV